MNGCCINNNLQCYGLWQLIHGSLSTKTCIAYKQQPSDLTCKQPFVTTGDSTLFLFYVFVWFFLLFFLLLFFFSEKIWLSISCELYAWQTVHTDCQALFSTTVLNGTLKVKG